MSTTSKGSSLLDLEKAFKAFPKADDSPWRASLQRKSREGISTIVSPSEKSCSATTPRSFFWPPSSRNYISESRRNRFIYLFIYYLFVHILHEAYVHLQLPISTIILSLRFFPKIRRTPIRRSWAVADFLDKRIDPPASSHKRHRQKDMNKCLQAHPQKQKSEKKPGKGEEIGGDQKPPHLFKTDLV